MTFDKLRGSGEQRERGSQPEGSGAGKATGSAFPGGAGPGCGGPQAGKAWGDGEDLAGWHRGRGWRPSSITGTHPGGERKGQGRGGVSGLCSPLADLPSCSCATRERC